MLESIISELLSVIQKFDLLLFIVSIYSKYIQTSVLLEMRPSFSLVMI